jgi:hypothetical protein
VITNPRKIFYPTATNEDDGVLLKIVAFTWDVGIHLFTITGEFYPGDFPQSGVWFLRCGGVHTGTNAPTLRTAVQSWRFALPYFAGSSMFYQLLYCRHLIIVF